MRMRLPRHRRPQPRAHRALLPCAVTVGFQARSYQLDPWWLPMDPAGTGVLNFTAGAVFGYDADSLVQLGLPWLLYTSFWSPTLSQMVGFDMVASLPAQQSWFPGIIGRVDVTQSESLYDVVMSRIVVWGGNGYEVDFMDFNTLLFTDTRNNTVAADMWLDGMNSAAMRHNISMQVSGGVE